MPFGVDHAFDGVFKTHLLERLLEVDRYGSEGFAPCNCCSRDFLRGGAFMAFRGRTSDTPSFWYAFKVLLAAFDQPDTRRRLLSTNLCPSCHD